MIARCPPDRGSVAVLNSEGARAYDSLVRRPAGRLGGDLPVLAAVAMTVLAGLVLYSQAVACYEDEGHHLLAAQLIRAGHRPYVDFFYQHPPLYAYLTAAWMRIAGDSWRSPHLMSALLTAVSALIAGEYVYSRLEKWRRAGAVVAMVLASFQFYVIAFGTLGQAYGLCLFAVALAFRLAVAVADEHWTARCFGCGLAAGAAAASWLLTAPVVLILLVWLVGRGTTRQRWKKGTLFTAGTVVPFLPLLWLAWQAPRAALFDVVEFHLFYRSANLHYHPTFRQDVGTAASLLAAPAVAVPLLLGAVALLFASRGEWAEGRKREFYLCAWLIAGLSALAVLAHPAFPQYFLPIFPFLGILGALGVCALGQRIWTRGGTAWPAVVLVALCAAELLLPLYRVRYGYPIRWQAYEEVARAINRVTPADGSLYADTLLCYVAARRLPPPGLESDVAPPLNLPPQLARSLHAVSQAELDEWLAAGRFDTVCLNETEEKIRKLDLSRVYTKQTRINGYCIFWRGAVH